LKRKCGIKKSVRQNIIPSGSIKIFSFERFFARKIGTKEIPKGFILARNIF
jgi:hypothetical protein